MKELDPFFKSVIDNDRYPIVICDLKHTMLYLNPAAIRNYADRGGEKLAGRSLLDCHNAHSNEMITKVVDWFGKSKDNNVLFVYYNEKKNRDTYMVALRDESGELIGYYEKHEFRDKDLSKPFNI